MQPEYFTKGNPMLKRMAFSLFLILLSISLLPADEAASKKAAEIKTKSDEFMKNGLKDYSATILTRSNMSGYLSETTARVYQKYNPDGSTFRRTETRLWNTDQIMLTNKEGSWTIKGKVAQKNAYAGNPEESMKLLTQQFGSDAVYELEEKLYYEIPCYLIKVTSESAKTFILNIQKQAAEAVSEKIKKSMRNFNYEEVIPVSYGYLIGKDNYFLYATNGYNKNNELMSMAMYKDVKINTGLKDEVFDLPTGVEIKQAPTMEEMLKNIKDYEEKTSKEKK